MTDSEIVEAARRYPTVEDIAKLLADHALAADARSGWHCLSCAYKASDETTMYRRKAERAHQASVIVAMWEELAKEHE